MRITKVSATFALSIFAAAVVAAQDPRGVSFEAASIESNPVSATGARGRVIVCQGVDGTIGRPAFVSAGPAGVPSDPIPQGRCTGGNVTLLTLVATAYGVSERNVSGAPAWVVSDGFQVEAKAENAGTVTTEETSPNAADVNCRALQADRPARARRRSGIRARRAAD